MLILISVDNSKMKDAEEDYDNNFFGVKDPKEQNGNSTVLRILTFYYIDTLNSNSKDTFEAKGEKKKSKHKRSK